MPLEHSEIRKMLEVATVAARLAGQRAMEDIKYITPEIKNGSEIVTQADRNCQKIILDRIKENYPDHGFVAEEGPDGGPLLQRPRSSTPIWWIIDPIDGTNNYSHGILDFAVSIAAVYEGSPVVAAIFDPATDSMYTAATDTDAQLNFSRINTSEDDIDKYSSFGIDSHFQPDQADAVARLIKETRFRNLGSTALHLAYVAKGSMIGCMTTTTKIWDIAAGTLIIENAGGIVTDLQGAPIFPIDDIEKAAKSSHLVLAANKKTYKKLKEMLHV
ncbi:MAG: inositol monophosphatase [Planctomycetes bacterium]|nr:inositol monophosphatase [Planctomycetota bacterium]